MVDRERRQKDSYILKVSILTCKKKIFIVKIFLSIFAINYKFFLMYEILISSRLNKSNLSYKRALNVTNC